MKRFSKPRVGVFFVISVGVVLVVVVELTAEVVFIDFVKV
jgi:hypothetical protein